MVLNYLSVPLLLNFFNNNRRPGNLLESSFNIIVIYIKFIVLIKILWSFNIDILFAMNQPTVDTMHKFWIDSWHCTTGQQGRLHTNDVIAVSNWFPSSVPQTSPAHPLVTIHSRITIDIKLSNRLPQQVRYGFQFIISNFQTGKIR